MLTNPWFYLAGAVAVLLVGISKSGFGGGVGLLGVPLLALVVDPRIAAAVMLPILCLTDIFSVWMFRRTWSRAHLVVLLTGGAVGIIIGTLTFGAVSEPMLRLIIGGTALLFVLDRWLRPAAALKADPAPSRLYGGLAGLIAGFTSFVAHAGGPPVSMYLLPKRLERQTLLGTFVMFFAVVNYVKLVPYAALGQFSPEVLWAALALAPLCPLAVKLGVHIATIVDEVNFYRICYGALAITGLKLTYDGIAGLV